MVSHIRSQKALENILWNGYPTQIYKVKSHFIKKEKKKKKEDTIMPLTTTPTPITTISTTVQQDNLAS